MIAFSKLSLKHLIVFIGSPGVYEDCVSMDNIRLEVSDILKYKLGIYSKSYRMSRKVERFYTGLCIL